MLKITGFLLHTIYYAKYSAKYQECIMSESSLLSSRQMESNGKDRWKRENFRRMTWHCNDEDESRAPHRGQASLLEGEDL